MNAAIRITGLCCLTVCLGMAFAMTRDLPETWGGILALMALCLGENQIKSAARYIFKIDGQK